MPQVPGLVPDQTPSLGGSPDVSLGVPVDAFGGAVGHALSGLGHDIEGASDKIWAQAMNMQNLQNETEAKSADADYMMKAGMLHAQFNAKEGNQASPEALQAHIQELQDLRVKTRGGLSNPMAQKLFDGSSLSFMGRTIFNAAGHAAQQSKVAANNASTARVQATQEAISASPADDLTFLRGKRAIESEVESQGRNSGWSPEQTEETSKHVVSDTIAKRATTLAKTDLFGAQTLYDQGVKSKALLPQDADKVSNTLQVQFRNQGSRIISDTVLGDRRSGDEENIPAQDYIDRAMKMVDTDPRFKSAAAADPLFKDFVREKITSQYNRQRAVETDADNMNVRTIGQAMMKANQEGLRPSTVEQLLAVDPAVGPVWDEISRNPKLQMSFLKTLEHNATAPHIAPSPENLALHHAAIDQANTGSQEQQAEFMSHDWANETKMTYAQRSQLLDLQSRKLKAGEANITADPRVGRALGILDQEMFNAGITKTGSPDNYHALRGALQSELIQYQSDNKKMPKPEEILEMGKNLMRSQTIKGAGWFGFDANTPVYQIPITDEDKAPIVKDYTAKFGKPPGDAMIERIVRAQHYKQFYGGSAKKGSE